MVKLTIPSEDILGDNYNITDISVSNYNPTIDGTVTLTVTVKDVYGDAVSGESVLVTASAGNFTKYNGSTITGASSYTGTTNSSGQFTLTYTCSEWGLITFSANNNFTQIMVKGWRQLKTFTNTGVIKTNGEQVHIFCNETISNVGSRATYGIGTVTVGYAPSTVVAVEASADQAANHKFIVKADGSISVVNATSSSASITVWNTIVYPLI